MQILPNKSLALALGAALTMTACGHNDNNSKTKEYSYEVTVTNLTQGQPMSPVAVILHHEGKLWTLGETASNALEVLAEDGSNTELLALDLVDVGVSGEAPIGPGGHEVMTISVNGDESPLLSVATMLVNTNDAFTGINALDVSNLALNESISLFTSSYDAGTEKNSELTGTIPGPADGGEGYDATRDDVDFVAMHPGVVSHDDGLAQSVLTFDHRFDNPTLKINITRVK